jgi:xanthine/uracil/vitamin C permease (AzgA family)
MFSAAFTSLQGKRMHLATMWLGISGLAFMAMLLSRHVKGAIMIGEQQSNSEDAMHPVLIVHIASSRLATSTVWFKIE